MLRRLFSTSRCFNNKEHYLKVNAWHIDPNHVSTEKRLPKKKVALLLGYNGSGYQGMQANPGIRSIEDELFKALVKIKAISQSNASDPKKVQLMRAARTDKGVHAACNVVSLKMICQDPQLVQKLNYVLPPPIRIWGYVETQRTFHAKTKCDSRIYEYLLPSYTLDSLKRKRNWLSKPSSERDYQVKTDHGETMKYITPTDPKILKSFRVNTHNFDKFKQAMLLFQGTHNFHNYTIAKTFADPSCNRFMMDISVDEPILIEGMEWISVKLHGQSFMLHQIRKMITMAMYSVRTNTPLSFLSTTFDSTKINIPKAPALGLLLDRPVFGLYNERISSIENRLPIQFDLYTQTIAQFKNQSIYQPIFEQEIQEQTFDRFLASIDSHLDTSYGYFSKIE